MMTMKSKKTMKTMLAALTAMAVVTVYSLPVSAYAIENTEENAGQEALTTQSEANSHISENDRQASGSEEKNVAGSKEEKSEADQKEEEKTPETSETPESSETPEAPVQAAPQTTNSQLQPEEVQEAPSYNLAIKYNGKGSASISPYKAKEGETVTVTADPKDGWKFDNIKGTFADGTSIAFASTDDLRIHTFTMKAQGASVCVNFEKMPANEKVMHTITVNVVSGGGVAYANVSQAAMSDSVRMTMVADSGYRFKDASGNVDFVTGYKFSMPNEDVIINVAFEKIPATTPPAVTPPAVNPPEDSDTGGRLDRDDRTQSTAPVEDVIEDEATPLGDADLMVEEENLPVEETIEEEDVPLAELPKTGGMGSIGFLGLGALLATLGIGLKRKEEK